MERILSIGRALDLRDSEIQLMERAYSFKLLPDYAKLSPAVSYLFLLLPHLKSSVLFALGRLLGIANAENKSLPELLALWEERYADSLGLEMTALRASLVLLLFSIERNFVLNAKTLQEALSRHRLIKTNGGLDKLNHLTGLDLYTELRSILLRRWEDQCH